MAVMKTMVIDDSVHERLSIYKRVGKCKNFSEAIDRLLKEVEQ